MSTADFILRYEFIALGDQKESMNFKIIILHPNLWV